jgi:hypothetical protein
MKIALEISVPDDWPIDAARSIEDVARHEFDHVVGNLHDLHPDVRWRLQFTPATESEKESATLPGGNDGD